MHGKIHYIERSVKNENLSYVGSEGEIDTWDEITLDKLKPNGDYSSSSEYVCEIWLMR